MSQPDPVDAGTVVVDAVVEVVVLDVVVEEAPIAETSTTTVPTMMVSGASSARRARTAGERRRDLIDYGRSNGRCPSTPPGTVARAPRGDVPGRRIIAVAWARVVEDACTMLPC